MEAARNNSDIFKHLANTLTEAINTTMSPYHVVQSVINSVQQLNRVVPCRSNVRKFRALIAGFTGIVSLRLGYSAVRLAEQVLRGIECEKVANFFLTLEPIGTLVNIKSEVAKVKMAKSQLSMRRGLIPPHLKSYINLFLKKKREK